MTPTLEEIDTTAIDAAMREMSRRTGISRPDIMRAEGAAILDKCILWTKMATIGKITANAALRARRTVNADGSVYLAAKSGNIYVRTNHHILAGSFNPRTNTGKVGRTSGRPLGRSLASAARSTLARARELTKENNDGARQARGLAVQSWVQIADAARMPIQATAKVSTARSARSRTGIFYRNGSASETVSKNNYQIRMVNTLPYNIKIGMGGMFNRAMAGRVKYFENNLRRGVFENMQAVAARYPGLRAVA